MSQIKIATLATCYNRAEKTERALKGILSQDLGQDVLIQNFIVDDQCSDNTVQLAKNADKNITILTSPGGLYWAGGMRFGYERVKSDFSFDFFLFYNDDVEFEKNALKTMLEVAREEGDVGAIVGNIRSKLTGASTYGLKKIYWKFFPIKYKLVSPSMSVKSYGHTMNMNAVLVPTSVLEKIGFLSDKYQHSQADIEFGYRIYKSGLKVVSPHGYQGSCELNEKSGSSFEQDIRLKERFLRLGKIKEMPFRQNYAFNIQMYGAKGLFFLATPYLKILFMHFLYKVFRQ
jgi:GT2 family glycosyltransferase